MKCDLPRVPDGRPIGDIDAPCLRRRVVEDEGLLTVETGGAVAAGPDKRTRLRSNDRVVDGLLGLCRRSQRIGEWSAGQSDQLADRGNRQQRPVVEHHGREPGRHSTAFPACCLPLDSLEEFSLQTQGGPESGRNPGGTINLIVKSGTNQLHGSAYYYNRNEFLAAQSPFAPEGSPKNKLRNQHYGFSLGGPIIKDKTFFFATYEEQKFVIGSQALATTPTVGYQQEAHAVAESIQRSGESGFTELAECALARECPHRTRDAEQFLSLRFRKPASATMAWLSWITASTTTTGCPSNGSSDRAFKLRRSARTSPYYYQVGPMHVQNYSLIYNTIVSPHGLQPGTLRRQLLQPGVLRRQHRDQSGGSGTEYGREFAESGRARH